MPKRTSPALSNPFIATLARVAKRLQPRLIHVLTESEAQAHGYGSEVGHMVGAVRSLCTRGGKRLRPGLCVVGALCHDSQADWTPALEAGISLELLQAYFLIHDDWMDQDNERRGGPTAHVELGQRFRSRAMGEKSAILAGDHAIALATAHLAELPVSSGRLKKALRLFAEMQLDAVAGQQLDIRGRTSDPELTYQLKTASYTVRGPLTLGATLAGAPKNTLQTLEHFSLPAGIAFQLRDDLIGVFGSPKKTGKPQGGDLTEGKNTSLFYEGRKRLSGAPLKKLEQVHGNRKATALQLRNAIALLEECGAKQAVERRILELRAEAASHVNAPCLTPQGRKLLAGAISALTDRKS